MCGEALWLDIYLHEEPSDLFRWRPLDRSPMTLALTALNVAVWVWGTVAPFAG
jgi:hypothetical protein